jgi:putative 2-oxoglutarate-Fe(II)-dependent oxygenase superfamily protein
VALETDIRMHVWSDAGLHAALAAVILAREAVEPGLRVSNVGGWHSAPDLLESGDAAVSELALRIRTDAAAVGADVGAPARRLHAWANVMRDGAYLIAHRHAAEVWSGVYYVDAGSDDSGIITSAVS